MLGILRKIIILNIYRTYTLIFLEQSLLLVTAELKQL